MASLRSLAVRLAVLTLFSTAACGDDSAPSAPDDGDMDAGEPDAGEEEDAGSEEEEDADATEADGGVPDVDAGRVDHDASDLSECEGDLLSFPAARAPGRPLSAGISGNRTHLVYVVPSCGGSAGNNSAQGLRYVSFATTGEAGSALDVANVGVSSCDRTRDPSVVVRGGKVELFYTANSLEHPYELFYDDDLSDETPAARETSANTRNEFSLAAGSFGDGTAVVYSAEQALEDAAGGVALKQPGQAAVELVADALGYHAGPVAFSELGASGERRGVAAFISDVAAKPGIFALPLGADGAPNGALVTLSTNTGGFSAVDVARGKDGAGGLIYTEAPAGVAHQLRFRAVKNDGTVSSTVRSLTTGNQDLRDISIAPYSHGYVIAYRRVGGLPNKAASIYLLFVDAEGNRAGTRLVHEATLSGGGLKVLVANDGRFVVLWAETESVMNPVTNQSEIGVSVRAARLNCTL